MNLDMGVGLSCLRRYRERDRGAATKLWPVIAFIAIGSAAAIWQWVLKPDMSPVLSYGSPSQTFFRPAVATEGDTIEFCLHGVTWHRLCPSTLTTYLKPSRGDRLDLVPYPINVPAQRGPVEKKCRSWLVPKIADRSNQMIFSGFAESLCGKKDNPTRIVTDLPAVPITINRRPNNGN